MHLIDVLSHQSLYIELSLKPLGHDVKFQLKSALIAIPSSQGSTLKIYRFSHLATESNSTRWLLCISI